jgi:hypothetical protein
LASQESVPLIEILANLLRNGSDGERLPTTIPGVSIIRFGKSVFRGKEWPPRLFVEIKPGNVRKGIYLRDFAQIEAFASIFAQKDKLRGVFELMSSLNGAPEANSEQ